MFYIAIASHNYHKESLVMQNNEIETSEWCFLFNLKITRDKHTMKKEKPFQISNNSYTSEIRKQERN